MGALAEIVSRRASATPDGAAIESARDDRRVTAAQLAALVAGWGSRLDAAGVPAGARLGLRGRDPVHFATSWLAIIATGRVVAPLAPDLAGEAFGRWEATVSPWLVVDADSGPLPTLGDPSTGACGPAGLLLTSSGTTGPAKLVSLREDQLLATARSVITAHELTEADRCLNPLPLWHINGEVVALLSSVVSGGCVVLDDRFHRTGYWQLVADRDITWLNAVPALFAILAREPVDPAPTSVRFARSASASLPPSVRNAFEVRTGLRVVETYGMTEAGSQITAELLSSDPAGRTPGSVGRPVGLELRIVDEEGSAVDGGVRGRVQIRGAAVITSYASEAGAQNLTADGWLDTGDLGFFDAREELVLDGRADDIINRGGEKLSPLHLEDALLGVEGVAAIAVVGVPHEILGMVPVAAVVAADGYAGDLAAAVTAAAEKALPKIARPVRVHLVESLNSGINGKVSRKAVLRMLIDSGLEEGVGSASPTAPVGAVPA